MIYLPYSNQYIGDRLATWMFYLNEVSSQLFIKSFFYVFGQIVKFWCMEKCIRVIQNTL